jgi:hypothetical protein
MSTPLPTRRPGPMTTASLGLASMAASILLASVLAPAALAQEAAPETPVQAAAPAPPILLGDDLPADSPGPDDQETLVELGGQTGDEPGTPSGQAAAARFTLPDPFADPAQSTMPGMTPPVEGSEEAGTELAEGTAADPIVAPVAPPAADVAESIGAADQQPDDESRLAAAPETEAEAEAEAPAALAEEPAETREPARAEAPPPPAAPFTHAPLLPPSRPAWAELDDTQRPILHPFEHEWRSWSASEKRRWLALANRVPKMSPENRARATTRIGEWAALTPEQRRIVLHNYRLASKLSPDERRAYLERYNEMSAEQRKALRARQDWTSNTAARHAGASTGLAREAAQPFVPHRTRDGAPR